MNTLLQNKWNMEASSQAEDESLLKHSALQALQELKKKLAVSSVLNTTVQEISCSLFPKEYHTKRHSILWLGCNTNCSTQLNTSDVSHAKVNA